MRAALTYTLIGAAAFLAFTWWRRERFKASLGADTYNDLLQLQPRIDAPVIRVPVPRLVI